MSDRNKITVFIGSNGLMVKLRREKYKAREFRHPEDNSYDESEVVKSISMNEWNRMNSEEKHNWEERND